MCSLCATEIPSVTADILQRLSGNFVTLATDKYASNVVEKCLKDAPDDQSIPIIREIKNSQNIFSVIQHLYGNYVAQSVLQTAKGSLKNLMINKVQKEYAFLHSHPHGKRHDGMLYSQENSFIKTIEILSCNREATLSVNAVLPNDVDLLNPPAELEKRKHKLIYNKLHATELMRRPHSDFIDTVQRDVTQRMRGVLVDCFVEVFPNDVDFLNPPAELEKTKHKLIYINLRAAELMRRPHSDFMETVHLDVTQSLMFFYSLELTVIDAPGGFLLEWCTMGVKMQEEPIKHSHSMVSETLPALLDASRMTLLKPANNHQR
ncbi:Armadillo-like helical [Cynara cardunculus var. scolymus]|uniref:Armadillo-like helical n=1 Tax=Cynara cardunculus var. scolymus TaxID=59895 RepID=A0A118K0S2_CYNCS|nr:Armadillo-like helical [Cynara cardunculus var. scolymus]